MKKKILLALAGIFLCVNAHADFEDWREIETNTNLRLSSVQFVNENVGFVGGWLYDSLANVHGILLKTTDGGESWKKISGQDVISMSFRNENTGYIFSFSQRPPLKTTDGGITWDTLDGFDHSSGINRTVYFVNDTLGFIGGTYLASIARTSDAGKTSKQVFGHDGGDISAIQFVTGKIGFAAGGDYILKTTDAGESWEKVYQNFVNGKEIEPFIRPADIYFFDENRGIAVGDSMKIFHTSDGGQNWTLERLQFFIPPDTDLRSIHFMNDTLGYAAGKDAIIIKTSDGGTSWGIEHFDFPPNIPRQFSDIFCLPNGKCFAVGANGIIMTNSPTSSVEENFSSDKTKFFPNPADRILFVELAEGVELVQIRDIFGNLILERQISSQENFLSVNVENFVSGVYFLKISSKEKIISKKFVVN